MMYRENIIKEILDGKRIPLIGFVEPLLYERYQRDDFTVTEEQAFADVKACGLDIMVGAQYNLSKHPDVVERILQACEKVGLYYLIRDNEGFCDKTEEEAEQYFKERYSPFLKYKSFGGINPTDEPGYSSWEKIRKFRRAFHRVFPDKLYFVNLLQNYAPAWALSNGAENRGGLKPDNDYTFYCTSYVKQADPTFFCYDFYPFSGEYPNIQKGYFEQLETVLQACAGERLPIWCFLQSSAFPDMSGIRRAPTYEELLWQANTCICYGTIGFAYFCYWIPVDDEHWHSAFIDVYGNKQATYEHATKINAYLRSMQPHLLNTTVCKVLRHNQTLTLHPFARDIRIEGNAVGSLMQKEKTEYVFLANESFHQDACVTVYMNGGVKEMVDVLTNTRYVPHNGKVDLRLAKGTAMMCIIK